MYKLQHNKKLNIIEVTHSNTKTSAKIYLNDGASLQQLTLQGHEIIKDLSPLKYNTTYASSILFPFANRIKDGEYIFDGKTFNFNINEPANNNALHGLIFNKTFNIIETETEQNTAKIVLEYKEIEPFVGFPFTYNLQVEYIFTETRVSLQLKIKNTSNKAFPFTLGWHPYFSSKNLSESIIRFNSSRKIKLDKRNITTGTKTITENEFKISDKKLDDCWILNSDEVLFKTPTYSLKFSSTAKQNFLQLYTPPKANIMAIEPTTGVSDSFNNKIGLQILNPNKLYNITWTIDID
ncbi:aldose 1-epimerase [Neotamlana laminarinivorans]|uniref:Aldose 1-epimerase n=1 Tax=Neotamlana laminarinivorans TaxID=2883124 RepID=A0A9X1HW32_9FLAO|nr:aldose 1-epimerase [Tamlana laminarinivorans]MCB4797254.1 aldose 1-epimerase [Tamlana laminarinivorans]